MITLQNGRVQNQSGLLVPNGSITFQLNVDATIIAAPGGIISASQKVIFQLDANGNILPPAGQLAAKIYSNLELAPQNTQGLGTYYLVAFYDANGARLNLLPMWWQFVEPANTTVDISLMTPYATVGGNVIFYPIPIGGGGTVTSVAFVGDGTILSATPSTPVTSSGNISATLLTQNANTILAGPGSGPAAAPTFRAIVAADLSGVISIATGQVAVGSGTGTIAGSSQFTYAVGGTLTLTSTSGSQNVTLIPSTGTSFKTQLLANNDGSFIILPDTTAGAPELNLSVAQGVIISGTATASTAIQFNGATSGTTQIGVAAIAGSPNRINLPIASGAAGGFLITDGNNPQQSSWTSLVTFTGGILTVNALSQQQRVTLNQGTAYSGADAAIVLGAGWGTGAAVSAAVGTDQNLQFTVTAGTTPSANPTLVITFKDGAWTNAPLAIAVQNGGTGNFAVVQASTNTTTNTLTWRGTPVNASTYVITVFLWGR